VLIVSATSGVHHQLAEGVLTVSPTDIEGTMKAMYQAITMTPEEREQRASLLAESVRREDITNWLYRQFQDIADLL